MLQILGTISVNLCIAIAVIAMAMLLIVQFVRTIANRLDRSRGTTDYLRNVFR